VLAGALEVEGADLEKGVKDCLFMPFESPSRTAL